MSEKLTSLTIAQRATPKLKRDCIQAVFELHLENGWKFVECGGIPPNMHLPQDKFDDLNIAILISRCPMREAVRSIDILISPENNKALCEKWLPKKVYNYLLVTYLNAAHIVSYPYWWY